MRKENDLILLRDLPNCPKGRVFKMDFGGNYYHSMNDDEALSGRFKRYKFTKDEVENNPEWFGTDIYDEVDELNSVYYHPKYLGVGHSIIPERLIKFDSTQLKDRSVIKNKEGYRLVYFGDTIKGYILLDIPGNDLDRTITDMSLAFMDPKYCDSNWEEEK